MKNVDYKTHLICCNVKYTGKSKKIFCHSLYLQKKCMECINESGLIAFKLIYSQKKIKNYIDADGVIYNNILQSYTSPALKYKRKSGYIQICLPEQLLEKFKITKLSKSIIMYIIFPYIC